MNKLPVIALSAMFLCSSCFMQQDVENAAAEAPFEENPTLSKSISPMPALGVDIFRQLVAQEKGNIVFSPASAEAALHLLKEGAAGATLAEMEKLPYGKAGVASAMQVQSANALFAAKDITLKPAAKNVIREPFATDLKKAVKDINSWCSKHTKGKINSIVTTRNISPGSRFIAVNAVYLKEKWLRPFQNNLTDMKGTFRMADGSVVPAAMMYQHTPLLYAEGADWQAVALFYRRDERPGEPGCFIGILPKKGDARAFAAKLTAQKYNTIRAALAKAEFEMVKVTLPRFEVTTDTMSLRPALESLGMRQAFTGDADFSKFSDEKLALSGLLQKCYVKVDEEGTEAAAVTIGIVDMAFLAPPCPEIKFDRPFIWAIGDLTTSASPWFMGLCEKP